MRKLKYHNVYGLFHLKVCVGSGTGEAEFCIILSHYITYDFWKEGDRIFDYLPFLPPPPHTFKGNGPKHIIVR